MCYLTANYPVFRFGQQQSRAGANHRFVLRRHLPGNFDDLPEPMDEIFMMAVNVGEDRGKRAKKSLGICTERRMLAKMAISAGQTMNGWMTCTSTCPLELVIPLEAGEQKGHLLALASPPI
ncbi:hypothetical protein BC936DRAFT_141050 [Jimgerdemannia flammicorona]|uniref:Uncharacterized protein n=1 Tax=Jimgerdemannia flammicorona TaxID=994334 RepID=A0A433A325_9FUNG|nr:hypothetical protein BC936DRAFT_141050 [Jimgerdemannia flammicorona]